MDKMIVVVEGVDGLVDAPDKVLRRWDQATTLVAVCSD
jgi:hypothetical protein